MRADLRLWGTGDSGPLPKGFRVLKEAPAWEEEWLKLLNSTQEFGIWDRSVLHERILGSLIPHAGILVAMDTDFVATASACVATGQPPVAVLQYVLVHPDFRRKGLGRIITIEAMNAAYRAGYKEMVLKTDDFRIQAIKLYLALGFQPDLSSVPETSRRWKRVLSEIN
jgi:GNAT superfamily N-acetyltransferase